MLLRTSCLDPPTPHTTGTVAATAAADPVDFEEMAAEKNRCPETQHLLGGTSLKLAFRQCCRTSRCVSFHKNKYSSQAQEFREKEEFDYKLQTMSSVTEFFLLFYLVLIPCSKFKLICYIAAYILPTAVI